MYPFDLSLASFKFIQKNPTISTHGCNVNVINAYICLTDLDQFQAVPGAS